MDSLRQRLKTATLRPFQQRQDKVATMFSLRFKESLQLWVHHLWPLFVVTAPFAVLNLAVQWYFGNPYELVDEQIRLHATSLVIMLLIWPLAEAALVAQISAIQAGQEYSLGQCLYFAIKFGSPLLLANLLMATASGIGLFLLILPGIWIYARLSMLPFVLVLESKSPVAALKESFEASHTHQWPLLFGIVFLTLFVFSVTNLILTAMMALNGLPGWFIPLVGGMIYALLNTLTTIYVYRFYLLART